jgi:hypothetical protein
MTVSNSYDWIVLGDHPAALLSANLVAKLGLSVLILTESSARKVVFSKSGQCLDLEPNFIAGMGEKGVLEGAFRGFSAMPTEGDLSYVDAHAQILTPETRLQIRESLNSTKPELDREFASESPERKLIEHGLGNAERVLDYWRAFPSRLNLSAAQQQQQQQKKRIKETPANWGDLLKKLQFRGARANRDLCEALSYACTQQLPGKWNDADWSHAIALGTSGASFRGGLTAYRNHLLRSAKKLGATIVEGEECRRIFVENRRFMGVQISGNGNMVSATGCILGSSVSEVADRMSFTGIKWLGKKTSPKPVGWRFSLAVLASKDAIPPGLSRRSIWKEPGAPVLEIEVADPADYGTRQADQRILFLRTVLPYSNESLNVEYQRIVAARMFRVATELVPFLEQHVSRVFPDFRVSPAEGGSELSDVYQFQIPQMIPGNLRVYEMTAHETSTGVEGLFAAAGDSFPKLGSLGPVVAAIEATAWIAHRSGLPGPIASQN